MGLTLRPAQSRDDGGDIAGPPDLGPSMGVPRYRTPCVTLLER
jgi:hypothetical protein